jgi:phospholipid-transporting ATPase
MYLPYLHEHDSVRKRISFAIRFPDNVVKMFVKGSDTSMFSILANDNESSISNLALSIQLIVI